MSAYDPKRTISILGQTSHLPPICCELYEEFLIKTLNDRDGSTKYEVT